MRMMIAMDQGAVGTISGGWHRPLAYTLQVIDKKPKPEKRDLMDLLATAAEFYIMGREKGREEATQEFEEQEKRERES